MYPLLPGVDEYPSLTAQFHIRTASRGNEPPGLAARSQSNGLMSQRALRSRSRFPVHDTGYSKVTKPSAIEIVNDLGASFIPFFYYIRRCL